MKILARSKDTLEAAWTQAEPLLRAEAAEVWRLTKSGLLQNIWFTHPGRDAVILLECPSIREARSILDGLPLVKAGFIEFDVVELVPYDGFERLFVEAVHGNQLQAQREELNQLRSELDIERRRIHRSITVIQSHVDDLDRSLKLASAEIWGDGSSTGSLLSTALRSLTSVQAEIDALGNALRAGQ